MFCFPIRTLIHQKPCWIQRNGPNDILRTSSSCFSGTESISFKSSANLHVASVSFGRNRYIDCRWFDARRRGAQQSWFKLIFPDPVLAIAGGLGIMIVVKWTLQVRKKWLVREHLASIGASLLNAHNKKHPESTNLRHA